MKGRHIVIKYCSQLWEHGGILDSAHGFPVKVERIMGNILFRAAAIPLLVMSAFSACAEGQVIGDPKSLEELVEQALTWYSVYPNSSEKEPLKPKPILNWGNAIRNSEVKEAVTTVLEYKGRPCVLLGVFPSGGDRINHEFSAVSREPGVFAQRDKRTVWSPDAKEVMRFKDLPNSKAPHKSARLRGIQMKKLAERFTIGLSGDIDGKLKDRPLRRLPTPVHRYGAATGDTLDGAIFAFCVHGNDPEAFLFIEAYRNDDKKPHTWQYAFSKSAGGSLTAILDKKTTIWKTDRSDPNTMGPTRADHFIWLPIDHAHLVKKEDDSRAKVTQSRSE